MLHINQFPFEMRKNYLLDSIAGIFYGLFQGLVITFCSVTLRKLQAGVFAVSFISMAPFIAYLATLLWAYLSSRGNKVLWVSIPTIIARAVLLFSYFMVSPSELIILLCVHFFLEVIATTPYSAVMKEIYPDEYRSQAMGYVKMLSIIATIAGSIIGGKLFDIGGLYSYRWIFPIGGLMGMTSSFIFGFIKLPMIHRRDNHIDELNLVTKSIKNIVSSKTLVYLFAVEFIIGISNLIALGMYPLFQVDIMKLPHTSVGILNSFISVGGIIFLYIWGRTKVGKISLDSYKKVVYMVPLLPFLYAISHNYFLLCLSSFLAGVCWNGWDILLMNYLIQNAGKGATARGYVGIRFTMLGIRGTLTPLIIHYVLSVTDIRIALLITVFTSLAGCLLISILKDEIVTVKLTGKLLKNNT